MTAQKVDEPEGSARVWIVDDSPLQGEICRSALSQYDVEIFGNGPAALEGLGSGAAPDLIVLDWHMPDLAGIDVCRFVRETRDSAQLPILILTATAAPESLVEAFDAGANDFVMKPFSRTELNARVAALVRHKHLHFKLAQAEGRLRVEAEFRERFIGMLAHDLRQPLNTFVLANQTLAKGVSSRSSRLLEMQRSAADRMSRMVAELLDFTRSRPETGMPIERRFVDLEPVARTVLEEMQVGHPSRAFDLTVKGICAGYWDRDRLAQVCSNLIGNAIEHSLDASSPIEVRLERRPDEVQLTVSNHGKPIPSGLLPTLFEPFRRGLKPSRASGGVGLGLHIVSEIARAHGGSITARSDEGATVFVVTLPVGVPDDGAATRDTGSTALS
jgi:signal transduction histidine kinase